MESSAPAVKLRTPMFLAGIGTRPNCTFQVVLFLLSISVSAGAQGPVVPSDENLVNKFLDQESPEVERLNCEIKPQHPVLDFAFRFDVGYVVQCPVKEFEGKQSTVLTFVRITPEGGERKLFGEAYGLPEIPENMRAHTDVKKLKGDFDFSGGFSAGEGRYAVDLLVVDKRRKRLCRKSWKVSVARKHEETKIPLAVADHTAVPMAFFPWTKKPQSSDNGLRLTILLDAAPIFPYAQKLRAWDRSFLLSTLSTVLEHMDSKSVRVVAFNLDQQKEIFRDDLRGQSGFIKLNQAMRDLELGRVSYQILQQRQGATELLTLLANKEKNDPNLSDLVILLGPHTRYTDKIPAQFLQTTQQSNSRSPQFFYLEYMPAWLRGAEFADNVEQVTKAFGGKTYKIYSPADLASAIQKVISQVHSFEAPD